MDNELKDNYWKVVSRTRISGRISPSVKERVEASWQRFDEDVISQALRIHISRYPTYKENYTVGIMRNLQRQKDAGHDITGAKKNQFNQGGQRNDYDFEALEKGLLAN